MNLKKVLFTVAAGSAVVMGLTASSFAQSAGENGPIKITAPSGKVTESESKTAIQISYEVESVATIDEVPSAQTLAENGKITGIEQLLDVAVENTSIVGNLGMFKVTTNHSNWDVIFNAANGGKLKTTGTSPVALKMTNDDELPLKVAVGIVTDPANPSTEIHRANVSNLLATRGAATGIDAISLARELAVGNPTDSNSASYTIDSRELSESDIGAKGFASTGGVIFFVNVGLKDLATDTAPTISGNPNGEYYETLTFTLVSNY